MGWTLYAQFSEYGLSDLPLLVLSLVLLLSTVATRHPRLSRHFYPVQAANLALYSLGHAAQCMFDKTTDVVFTSFIVPLVQRLETAPHSHPLTRLVELVASTNEISGDHGVFAAEMLSSVSVAPPRVRRAPPHTFTRRRPPLLGHQDR